MRRSDWGPEFGPYELFCCEEAIKIATALGTEDKVRVFGRLEHEEQKKMVPGLDYGEHSGNTFGTSVQLALFYVSRPEMLYKVHGALCPLVGCNTYGCWSTTSEAHVEV